MNAEKNVGTARKKSNSKKVLIISYAFPPIFGPEVYRTLKFVKYLPSYGWKPIVLTSKILNPPPQGLELKKEIPSAAKIYRTLSIDRYFWSMAQILKIKWEMFPIPDEQIVWFPLAVARGLQIVKKEKIDLIYSSSDPWTVHIIAYFLKRITKKPWVMDMRDPRISWAYSQEKLYRDEDAMLRESLKDYRSFEYMQRTLANYADRMTMITHDMKKNFFHRFPEVSSTKCIVIPNGFDFEDFTDTCSTTERFTLTYAGSLYDGRTLIAFLDALTEVVEELSIVNDIRVIFAGPNNENIQKIQNNIKNTILDRVIEWKGFLSDKESINLISSSDALLFFQPQLLPRLKGVRNSLFSLKLFNYLATGKPVLGLADDSPAKDLIIEANAGVVVQPNDHDGIKDAIKKMYEKYKDGTLQVEPKWNIIKKYDRRVLTKQLADVFEEITTS